MANVIKNFPSYWESPLKLFLTEGNCGLVTAWAVLKYFRKRTSSARIIEMCKHSEEGIYSIVLAVALRMHGLSVSYFSECDPKPTPIEIKYFREARKVGVIVREAIGLNKLIDSISVNSIPIVMFNTPENSGHFSPLIGVEKGKLILPYAEQNPISKRAFLKQWGAEGFFKECIIVSNTKLK